MAWSKDETVEPKKPIMHKGKAIGWESRLRFGKHKGKTLLQVLTKDKPRLRYCYEQKLHTVHKELEFLFQDISPAELNRILRS